MKDITREEVGAALVWLRNKYDTQVSETQTFKKQTLEIIDKVLLDDEGINPWIGSKDMIAFREKYFGRKTKP
jgi:hypothetical protein